MSLHVTSINTLIPDSTGNVTVTLPSPTVIYTEVTKVQADALIAANSVVPGVLYKITGVHPTLYNDGTNSGISVFLKGMTINKFDSEGTGQFYNPLYTATAPFNIWNNRNTFTISAVVGTFNLNETITNNLGGTATLISVAEDGLFTITAGTWIGATTITGTVSGATANIANVSIKTFAIGDKTIWGGYVWSNVNGNVGVSTNSLTLNTEWSKIVYNTTDYNFVTDIISFSYVDNKLTKRYDIVSDNEVQYTAGDETSMAKPFHAISVFQWGNKYTGSKGTGSNDILNSYVDNINHQSNFFSKNIFRQASYYTNNTVFGGTGIYNNTITGGAFINNNLVTNGSAIFTNILGEGAAIRDNNIHFNSFIYSNIFNGAGYIGSNKLLSYVTIRENVGTSFSYIFNNTVRGGTGYCQIYSNSLFKAAYIRDNTIDTRSIGGATSYSIMNNVMFGGTGNYVTGYNNTTKACIIGYNTLTGYGQIVENQMTSGEISYCTLTNCLVNRNFLRNSSVVRNINSNGYHVERLEIGGMFLDYGNLPLTANSQDALYSQLEMLFPISKTFDGSANNGAIGAVTINNFIVPIGYFIKELIVDVGTGLTGVSAVINFGIETDALMAGLNDTTGNVSTLNTNGITSIQSSTFTKATALRRLYMEVKGAPITAGTITIKVKLIKLQ